MCDPRKEPLLPELKEVVFFMSSGTVLGSYLMIAGELVRDVGSLSDQENSFHSIEIIVIIYILGSVSIQIVLVYETVKMDDCVVLKFP